MSEHYQNELDRCRDEFRAPPTDYERAAHADWARIRLRHEEQVSKRSFRLPKWVAFFALALIAVFVFLILQGCTAPLVQRGEMCDYMTNKGVLVSRPCASRK